jgi:hypothetical protein
MEAKINIRFKKILGKKVDDKLLKENPKLMDVTKDTTIILCQQIKRYFEEHKIKVGVSFTLHEK